MPTGFCVPPAWSWAERTAKMHALAVADVPWARATFGPMPPGVDALAMALATAQRAAYVPDPASCATDFYKRPSDTWREGGDCDDLCILLLCLALSADLSVVPERIALPHAPQDHLACLGWDGAAWRWCDPSQRGARVGEHPAAAATRLGAAALPDAGSPRPTAGLATQVAGVAAAAYVGNRIPWAVTFAFGLGVLLTKRAYAARAAASAPRANPFAGFVDFRACERAARRRGVDDSGAYCGAIQRRVEAARPR